MAFGILWSPNLFGQKNITGLEKIASDDSKSDSLRFYTYFQILDSIPAEDWETRSLYVGKANEIAIRSKRNDYQAKTAHALGNIYSFKNETDSALSAYRHGLNFIPEEEHLELRCEIYWSISESFFKLKEKDSTLHYGLMSNDYSLKARNYHAAGWRYNALGERMFWSSNPAEAIDCWKLGSQQFTLLIPQDIDQAYHGLNNSNINIAMAYSKMELWDIAIDHVETCLSMEKNLSPYSRAWTQYILSSYYGKTEDREKQLSTLRTAIKSIEEAISNETDENARKELFRIKHMILLSLSEVNIKLQRLDKAENYLKKAKHILDEHDYITKSSYHENFVHLTFAKGDTLAGLEECSIRVSDEKERLYHRIVYLFYLAEYYENKKDYRKVIQFIEPFERNPTAAQNIKYRQKACQYLSRAYAGLNDYRNAYTYQAEYEAIKDSLNSSERSLNLVKSTLKYDYQQSALQDSVNSAVAIEKKERLVKEEKAKNDSKQRTIYFISFGLLLVLALSIWAIRNGLQVKKANKIIQSQKEKVEEKNRDITDSINYASRIQNAILPPTGSFKKHLPDSFILYLPKDIVAGDFYWMEKVENTVIFAAADCTGHGVPGAMVSVVCHGALNRAVREFNLVEPAKILDKVRELVIETFDKGGEDVRDGMDIALCSLDVSNGELQYAGANNSLYYVQDGTLSEIKANKEPIGMYDKKSPFTNHQLSLEKGDVIYLFSDGYADQFGGEKGKKFKYKTLKNLLLQNSTEAMETQESILNEEFVKWRGEIDQVDDVCVIGVRV